MLIAIERADDPRLEDYRDIRDRDAQGAEARPGLFIGEQFLIVEKMLARPAMTKSVLIAPQHLARFEERFEVVRGKRESKLNSFAFPLFVAAPAIMEKVAGFAIHRGVLAVGFRPSPDSLTIDRAVPDRGGSGPLTVLLCESIRNIDNIGSLFRNAAAFAVDVVVLSPDCHDPLYRKSIRVSIGHVLSMPWARSTNWPRDLDRLKREWNLTLIAAAARSDAVTIDAIAPPQRVGIVVGSEFDGLSSDSRTRCDHIARIPMAAGVDSLNVATAAAVMLHHFSRGERV